jgi:catechol 2,3-dioxygenase-like lactoylglutathione lyase family enzyme
VITGSHFIFFSKDADADRRFFQDVFGFRAVDAGSGWLIFALPPSEAAFHPASADSTEKQAGHPLLGAVLYLMCDNLSEQIKSLAGKNVVCSPVAKERWGTRTSFRLPSGGEIGLYEPSHPTALGPTQIH